MGPGVAGPPCILHEKCCMGTARAARRRPVAPQVLAVSSAATAFSKVNDVPAITLAAWRLQLTSVLLGLGAAWQWRAMVSPHGWAPHGRIPVPASCHKPPVVCLMQYTRPARPSGACID